MKTIISNTDFFVEIERLLNEGHEVRFTPKGESMRPFIEGDKDCVVLKKKDKMEIGDIVLCCPNENQYVLHRIIAIKNEKIILMGDGNLTGTETCKSENILGTVIEIRNSKGRKKLLTHGYLWRHLLFARKYLLKIYRHLFAY